MKSIPNGFAATEYRPVVIENGTLCFDTLPGNLFPEVANIGYLNITAGTITDAATGSWAFTEPLCDLGSILAYVKREVDGDRDCEPGCSFETSNFGNEGILYIPFRWQESGQTEWYYGWSAFEVIETYIGECDFLCIPGKTNPMYSIDFRWVAVGYETSPDTGIVTGGGLCQADMDFSASLDFFDVSEFLASFGAGDLAADFTGDGILDFFDVSEFLAQFSSCVF